jgi:hypothetical protein
VTGPALPKSIVAAVLINLDGHRTVTSILQQVAAFADVDDVYQPAFSDAIILQTNDEESNGTIETLRGDLTGHFPHVYHFANSGASLLPPGLYFLHGNNIHQAWRLCPDDLDAFIFGVVPCDVKRPERFVIIVILCRAAG